MPKEITLSLSMHHLLVRIVEHAPDRLHCSILSLKRANTPGNPRPAVMRYLLLRMILLVQECRAHLALNFIEDLIINLSTRPVNVHLPHFSCPTLYLKTSCYRGQCPASADCGVPWLICSCAPQIRQPAGAGAKRLASVDGRSNRTATFGVSTHCHELTPEFPVNCLPDLNERATVTQESGKTC